MYKMDNYKTLMKKTLKTKKMEGIINVVDKLSECQIFPTLIYRFNAIQITILGSYFIYIDRFILKFI